MKAARWESPIIPWADCDEERRAKLRVAWGGGALRYKLDPAQRIVYDQIRASHALVSSSLERVFCMDISRQWGKDFLMSVVAVEEAIRGRKWRRVPYAAPTKDNVHELLVPTMELIFADCPPELLPWEIKNSTFRSNSPRLSWDWGATIVLVGVDLHPDWLRGPATHCFMFTEPAFVDELDEVMDSVLLPQLLTRQDGFGIMGSTPPVTPGHPWSTRYVPTAKTAGMYAKRVITDSPRLSEEQIAGAIKALGGMESSRVRRELFCEHIIETSLAAVPEFTPELRAKIVTAEGFTNPPAFRDTYVSIDPGFSHATGAVFAYYDFEKDLVMIEGDFNTRRLNSNAVARCVYAREWQLWGRKPVKPKKLTDEAWKDELELIKKEFYLDLPVRDTPVVSYRDGEVRSNTFRRVSDTDARLISDLANEHGLLFTKTDKDDTETASNAMRIALQNGRYRIHPRCVNLIAHLEQGTWNKSRTKLAEQKDGGHYDCLKAFEYLHRNMVFGKNPNPPTIYSRTTHHVPSTGRVTGTAAALMSAFSRRKR